MDTTTTRGLMPDDAYALIDLHRRHGLGRRWQHNCGTPAGYEDCNRDMTMSVEELAADLTAAGTNAG
jgi:hypothetical protein